MQFRKMWSWPKDVEEFISARARGFTVHLCCGVSRVGSLRIDKYEPADIKADMCYLPLRSNCIDTIICDPPWGMDAKVRPPMMKECMRVLKPGGLLLLNALWAPRTKGLLFEEAWFRRNMGNFGQITMLFQYRKSTQSYFT